LETGTPKGPWGPARCLLTTDSRGTSIATLDALGLENSIVRARVLISAALAAAKLLETGELEARIESLEAAVGVGRLREPEIDPTWA
jgi:hypothetical protein